MKSTLNKSSIKYYLNTTMPKLFVSLRFLRHLSGWKDLIEHIKFDLGVKKLKISPGNELFFIAGMPKSGSTWLQQLLLSTKYQVQLNSSCLRAYPSAIKLSHPHGLSPKMFDCVPKNKLSFLKLHPHPVNHNFEILDSYNVKVVVLIRDIRDMLISNYFHTLADKTTFNHESISKLSKEQGFIQSMKDIHPSNSMSEIEYYTSWIDGWIERSKIKPQNTLLIKYEDMHKDLPSTLKKIYDFYNFKLKNNEIDSVIARQKQKHENDLQNNLKTNLIKKGSLTSTYRKGKVGDWSSFFNAEDKAFTKSYSGSVLIKSGYEKNLFW